jgi:hypothetical protein
VVFLLTFAKSVLVFSFNLPSMSIAIAVLTPDLNDGTNGDLQQ